MARPRVTRLRELSPAQTQRLVALRKVSQLLDSAFVVPGTSYRIGLAPVLGLVPGLGDLVSPLFAIAVLWQARALGVPRVVQLRMLFNVAIDAVVGAVPIVGDLIDVGWKANDRNMTLLERYAYEEHGPSAADWLFVALMILLVVTVAAVPFLVVAAIGAAVARMVS